MWAGSWAARPRPSGARPSTIRPKLCHGPSPSRPGHCTAQPVNLHRPAWHGPGMASKRAVQCQFSPLVPTQRAIFLPCKIFRWQLKTDVITKHPGFETNLQLLGSCWLYQLVRWKSLIFVYGDFGERLAIFWSLQLLEKIICPTFKGCLDAGKRQAWSATDSDSVRLNLHAWLISELGQLKTGQYKIVQN